MINRIIPADEVQKESSQVVPLRNSSISIERNEDRYSQKGIQAKVRWQTLQIDRLNNSINRLQSELRNLAFQYSAVERSFCSGNKGCRIEITFLNKKNIQCRLIDSDKYCFIVEDGRATKPLLVLKSSVAFIRPLG